MSAKGARVPDNQAKTASMLWYQDSMDASPQKKAGEPRQQHLVSKMLLKQFAKYDRNGWKVVSFNLEHPDHGHRPKALRSCGWVENFVKKDASQVERLWGIVEQRVAPILPRIIASTSIPTQEEASALKDLIALHLVRSHWYSQVHKNAFIETSGKMKRRLVGELGAELRAWALSETGLYLTDGPAIEHYAERVVNRSEAVKGELDGTLFRESIERTFTKMRILIDPWGVEVLETGANELVIGDCPAVSVGMKNDIIHSYKMAVGDASAVVLPISRNAIMSLSSTTARGAIGSFMVDQLNELQIRAARKYVYFHPASKREEFVRRVCARIPAMMDRSVQNTVRMPKKSYLLWLQSGVVAWRQRSGRPCWLRPRAARRVTVGFGSYGRRSPRWHRVFTSS
ncbi:DUF4238 domain-containing protein [Actinomadura hibisca]|uniref:DUF4238 domain-containing protein n=1 Tax=Actinomadura hibisca TaxID=68565 RepID=UPI0014711BDF|nr:DUF4238 domain-containing protein [Actinomadura hibisca]